MGKRTRRQGDYLLIIQKPPITPSTWRDHGIRSRWLEKIDLKIYPRKLYPHAKPRGLITRLISALTNTGDLIIDPAAGSFVVMHAAHELERDFIGCDVSYARNVPEFNSRNGEVGLFNEGAAL
jgi:site-specific DNA-methyltransferase (adenine-specific)